jgi:tRNA 2-selenouridine synthase
MPHELTRLSDLTALPFDAIIDVRAPSEYAEDHLPGAINLPVLSDEERAKVGTIYKQDSPFRARKIGAAIVARNASSHLDGPLADRPGGWRPLVYCWRGGQRSGSFASILSQIGWRVEVLAGGYKSYRRLVVSALYDKEFPVPVVLLDGNTGTGKTEVLNRLPAFGVQVLDLEGLARHRGSALGGVGPQPGQKAFESALAMAMTALDPARPVVIEAESSRIGRLNLPPVPFDAMCRAPRIELSAPVSARAEFLARSYVDASGAVQDLSGKLERLVHLQGRARVHDWQTRLAEGRFSEVAAGLIEEHYDPRYARVRGRIGQGFLARHSAERLDAAGLDQLAEAVARSVREAGATRPQRAESGL